ncbi:hypothetical protein EKL98_02060 [Flavobacterium bomense]|uniref:Uncharacterized protein n=1 Tax=Flavobacterium bomense TaxID=2497483 RepID=A0A432CT33_9FLAO|nr:MULTISPECIES: hypothetical protein [Flavobacterium]RTZ08125.1 hypothetical protein EKL98_02060 [Flavobacterium bomense]RTZ09258.1 hypothetical protein EKM03_01320 [Flavobacterium sp. GSP6]
MNNIRREKLFIVEQKLVDGKIFEIERSYYLAEVEIGNKVSINNEVIKDGSYQISNEKKIYEVKNNTIIQIFTVNIYKTSSETEITVHQKNYWEISKGDSVFINSEITESQSIKLTKGTVLLVHDGKINQIKWKTIFHNLLYLFLH